MCEKRGYLTLKDFRDLMNKLDYDDLIKPVAVSEKTTGLTSPYFNDDEIIYGVRISSKIDKAQNFDGWVIEGLSKKEILKFNKNKFGE